MTTIVTRTVKGEPLTIEEVDQNFTNLNDATIATDANVAAANTAIASANTNITNLQSNAASQQTAIDGKANLSGATFTGNITAPYFLGDGSKLTGVASGTPSSITMTGTNSSGTYIPVMTNTYSGTAALYAESGGGFTYNPGTNTLTAGTFSGSGSGLTGIPTNAQITDLQSNAATQSVSIASHTSSINILNSGLSDLYSNAATQQTQINTNTTEIANLWSNAAAQSTAIAGKTTTTYVDSAISTAVNNLINSAPGTLDTLGEIAANLASGSSAVGAVTASIASTNANVTAANAAIASVTSTVGSHTTTIGTIQSDVGTLQSTVSGHTTNISNLQSNAASQQSSIDTISANIANIWSNDNAQQIAINNLQSNAATQATAIAGKADSSTLAAVATSGLYSDLSGKPTLFDGAYSSLTGKPTLATVATSGDYNDLINKPSGTGSSYTDANVAAYLPTYTGSLDASSSIVALKSNAATQATEISSLWSNAVAQATSIAGKADTSSLAAVATSGSYNDLSNKPSLFSGSYTDLTNKPTLFSGSYTDLTNKPTIPGADSAAATQLVYKNGSNVATGSSSLTFDGTNLSSPYLIASNSTGDEGGEILLAKPATNSTISGTGVTIDVYQNKLRIFEQGGSARGAYIDLTAATAGVGSNLLSGGGGASFTGDLNGNNLSDSSRKRVQVTGSIDNTGLSVYGSSYNNVISATPVYTSGVLQAPVAASSLQSLSGQTVVSTITGNVGLQSSYTTTNRNTIGTIINLQVTPVSANNMTNGDRVRSQSTSLDVNLSGKIWGNTASTSSIGATTLAAMAGQTTLLGTGSAGSAIGVNGTVSVTPSLGNVSLSYGTGMFSSIALAANSTTLGGTVTNARLFAGGMSGFTANLAITNAIALHTYSNWAGGTGTSGATNKYVLLNEDSNTIIKTNGDVILGGSGVTTGRLKVYKETINNIGSVTGSVSIDLDTGPVQTLTATGDITINSSGITNKAAGQSVTIIITQDGTGNRALTTDFKFAGGFTGLSTAAGSVDIINAFYNGSVWYASIGKAFA